MNEQNIDEFNVIGIAIRTTNENGQSSKDIPALWETFMRENITEKIPGKTSETIYCIYTDYEKDHTKPYTTILGCSVSHLKNIPAGMTGKTVPSGKYAKYIAQGNILQGMVYNAWLEIWNSNLQRKFFTDFEVYDDKAQNPENAVVEIFVSVK